ncbi:MAG: CdiI family contact-dependent growth inhibition immunity protein [Spirochaetes bacterium]|nr:CdiI family contact-dependent growth inhibition immunity protein [Spirochaetota bacterium]
MQKHDMIIYEFKDNYYFIQRSRQVRDREVSPSENTALTQKLTVSADVCEIGNAVLIALNNYDKIPPVYSPWELDELRKQLCVWVGARSYRTLVKNSRLVLVDKDFGKKKIYVFPFDNHNIDPWETMLVKRAGRLDFSASAADVGKAVVKAFSVATYHPERKDPSL